MRECLPLQESISNLGINFVPWTELKQMDRKNSPVLTVSEAEAELGVCPHVYINYFISYLVFALKGHKGMIIRGRKDAAPYSL